MDIRSLFLPALVGLVAGMAHGVVSHRAELPVSLTEQLGQVVNPSLVLSQSLKD